jgi:heme oxygenase (biliverdin-IX-beta and delta-forming)
VIVVARDESRPSGLNDGSAPSTRSAGLAGRLRSETEALHRTTEAAVGVPGSVSSRADYARLLRVLLAFYSAAQRELENPQWSEGWAAVGIDISAHDRRALLEKDLRLLGAAAGSVAEPDLRLESFAEALGCLYVVEGSSLGGRFLAPLIVEALGDVPTCFYAGEGREHPGPWRALQAALKTFEIAQTNLDDVVRGARLTFQCFGTTAASARWAGGS